MTCSHTVRIYHFWVKGLQKTPRDFPRSVHGIPKSEWRTVWSVPCPSFFSGWVGQSTNSVDSHWDQHHNYLLVRLRPPTLFWTSSLYKPVKTYAMLNSGRMCRYSWHDINSQTKDPQPISWLKSFKINVTKTSSLSETMLEVKVEHEINHEICPHSAHILARLWNWMTMITVLGQTKYSSTANKRQASKRPHGPGNCKYWATLRQWRNSTMPPQQQ